MLVADLEVIKEDRHICTIIGKVARKCSGNPGKVAIPLYYY